MTKEECLHAGHRERLTQKFLSAPDLFSDHELLEILLFSVVPRKDTNALAHRLISFFGGLDKVLEASSQQLMSVDGVGQKIATQLVVIGKILGRVKKVEKKVVKLKTFFDAINHIKQSFVDDRVETFKIFLLDVNYKLLSTVNFCDKNKSNVNVEVPEIITAFNIYKPTFAIVAHNHPSCCPEPSKEDELATRKLNVLCEINGVVLSDHIIVAGENAYSYRSEGRLEQIRQKTKLEKLFDKIQGEI